MTTPAAASAAAAADVVRGRRRDCPLGRFARKAVAVAGKHEKEEAAPAADDDDVASGEGNEAARKRRARLRDSAIWVWRRCVCA